MKKILQITLNNTATLYFFAVLFDATTYALCFTLTGIARSDIFNKIEGANTIIKSNIITLIIISTLAPLFVNITKQIGCFLFSTVQQNMNSNIKYYIYEKIYQIPINKKNIDFSGEIIIRFRDDVQDILAFFCEIYNQAPKLFMSAINIYVMFKISKALTLVVVIPLLIFIFLIHLIQERIVKNRRDARKSADKTMQFLGDIFGAIDVIKLSNKKESCLKHYAELCDLRGEYAIKDSVLQRILNVFSLNLMFLALATILFFTYSFIENGFFSIGNFILFEYYFWFLTDLPNVFSSVYSRYKQMSVARNRIEEINNTINDINKENGNIISIGNHKVEKDNKYLIKGKNGSGKSIYLKELFVKSNLCPPKICYLSQSASMISGTIQQNICLGMDFDKEKMKNALKISCLEQEFENGKLRLDYLVGNMGEQLSGGQRKRLALARLMYREPAIMLLDDVTTGLDLMTERHVMENIEEQRTVVIFASSEENIAEYVDHVINI